MIEIDGSEGEGGGQILRSALSLSLCTLQAFRIVDVRANREKPGLMRQHLTAVRAAAEISGASVTGGEIGSREVTFAPGPVRSGDFAFSVGTAGSCTLVLQTVLPALMTAAGVSHVRVTGGTHNTGSPPVDFLARAFLPLLVRMGPRVGVELVRYGFYPRGGGEIRATIEPAPLVPIDILTRGERIGGYADCYFAAIPFHVAERELAVVGQMLNWGPEQLRVRQLPNDVGPGNAITITIESSEVAEVATGFGEKGVSAEHVARSAAEQARQYLRLPRAAVGHHLADQLLLPMALAGHGAFTTVPVTKHFRSNAQVVERFLGKRVTTTEHEGAVSVLVD